MCWLGELRVGRDINWTYSGFLNVSTIDIWGPPVHFRVSSAIPSIHPLDASKNLSSPVVTTKNVSRHSQRVLGGQNHCSIVSRFGDFTKT